MGPIYRFVLLCMDIALRGPAIVDEDGSTTVIFPEWDARVDEVGNISLEAG